MGQQYIAEQHTHIHTNFSVDNSPTGRWLGGQKKPENPGEIQIW